MNVTQVNNQRIISPPNCLPVSLAIIKNHLKLDADDTSEDDLLNLYIGAATEYLQNNLRLQFCSATYQVSLDNWGSGTYQISSYVPLQAVESITYVDANGDEQTLDPENDYVVNTKSHRPLIRVNNMPPLGTFFAGVSINYIAGYSSSTNEAAQQAAIPTDLRNAVLLRAAALYENREDKQLDMNKILASMQLAGIHRNSFF